MSANDRQIGGNHYSKTPGEQLWDRAWRLKFDMFQFSILQYVERWKEKGGIEDLEKGLHYLEKYIEVLKASPIPVGPVTKDELDKMMQQSVDAGVLELCGVPTIKGSVGTVDRWTGFTFEGGTAETDIYKCKNCRGQIIVPLGAPPEQYHTYC